MKIIAKISLIVFSVFGLSVSAFGNSCNNALDYAAANYNASVENYNKGQKFLEAAKKTATCVNLENAFNSFASAFGGFGAGVSHAGIAKNVCKGADKNTANDYFTTIRNGYVQGARATYLASGIHYKSCSRLELTEANADIIEEINANDTDPSLLLID